MKGSIFSNRQHTMLTSEECWEAIVRRDANMDGHFYYAVIRTNTYCRPSCVARRPNRSNVLFFESHAQAELEGFRPCFRCSPKGEGYNIRSSRLIEKVCQYISDNPETTLSLHQLSAQFKISSSHLQKLFTATLGVSPREFQETCRIEALKRMLRKGSPVTSAIFNSGFGSVSRVYEKINARLGMTPSVYSRGGRGVTVNYFTLLTPFGLLMLGATDRGFCFAQLGNNAADLLHRLSREFPNADLRLTSQKNPQFTARIHQLCQNLPHHRSDAGLSPSLHARTFLLRVLQALPSAKTKSSP
jgi:AraC family transcriptional regulator, regulatory protein of adaptative response / methylated-DNA-[protein]-cysteine methyltransferase